MENELCANADRSFGPSVPPGCRGGFDFTFFFEDIFFSILPAIALLLAVLVRWWWPHSILATASQRSLRPLSKQCVTFLYSVVCLVILVFWTRTPAQRHQLSIPSSAINFTASVAVVLLSHIEQTESPRPSAILNIYLFGSSFLDAVRVRSLWLAVRYSSAVRLIAILSSVALGLKVILFVLEALPKNGSSPQNSPEERLGVFALRTFWWLNPLLWLGRNKQLESSDLYPIDSDLKTVKYSSQLTEAWLEADQGHKYALLKAVAWVLRWPLLLPAAPRLILIGFTYAQPLLIKRALDFVERRERNSNIGYGLIGATFVVYCGLAVFNGYYGHLLYRSITLVRGSLIDIIYHKSLSIELMAAQEAAPVGLVTADVERIDFTIEKIHSLWASIIEIGIAIYLLQREMGWACIGPVLIALVCTLSTSFVSKILPARQKKWNQAVQKRVALTSTMLSNMKTVKMMGFSPYIAKTLQAARMTELAASEAFRRCMTVINVIALVPKQLSAPFTFLIFVLAVQHGPGAGGLTASRAFTALTIIELVTTPLSLVLQTIPSLTSTLACLDRIQSYLKTPSKVHQSEGTASIANEKTGLGSIKISMIPRYDSVAKESLDFVSLKEASFAYKVGGNPILNSLSFNVLAGSITMVVGPVGSGKSSLLKAILNELDLQSGELEVRATRVGYCDSSPWIPNGTIGSCIVGMSEIEDDSWFDDVIHACALDDDILHLGDGLNTEIGSRGIGLSEGQKHRLALARAIFSRAPLLLLDDVFRSLDSNTEKIIFQRLLSPEGIIRRLGLTVVMATHSSRYFPIADQIIVLENGHVAHAGSFDYLTRQVGYIQRLSLQQSPADENAFTSSKYKSSNDAQLFKGRPGKKPQAHVPRVVGNRDKSVYTFYLRPIGVFKCVILLLAVIMLAVATRFQRIWVEWWTEDQTRQSIYIGVFFLLAGGACLSFAFFFWWMFMFVVPATAGSLHEQLLKSIIHAPLSYFTTIDSGVILNRFSQDMAIINGQLPVNIFQAVSIFMICLIQIAFIAYGSQYLAAVVPVLLVVLWILSRFYLLTSQQLRVLDLELKAPIYTGLTETKEGLATIRAFGWQSSYTENLQSRVDESKKAIYSLFMIQRWLNFVLDLIVAGLATTLMTLATQLRSSTNAATFGVGLSSVIGFSMNVSQFIVCYTELENSLGAISRTKDCVDNIEAEDSSLFAKIDPPQDLWPSKGAVEFRSVTATYCNAADPALKDISFSIPAGHKVCICGRTGSGKSTLISVLLRLLDTLSGTVRIDSIDTATLRSHTVRENITVIPQSPFFLPGSVRLNLDVGLQATDDAMIAALQKTGLWEIVSSRGGLDIDMSVAAFSHGQQQLFSLAAAMLKKSKIVVIDEATSGVDAETEKKMNELILQEFAECTVICIAHRLEMMVDYDLAVVLSHGRVMEMGSPRVLIEQEGEFWRLLEE